MSNGDGMKPRVLLVEDDPTSRAFMTAVLAALPAQVEAVGSVAAAMACNGPHEMWLLDANLPDGSGIDLLAQLRARQPATVALAHTADDSIALGSRLLAAGFAAVLLKPLSARELQTCVVEWLGTGHRRSQRVAEAPVTTPALWDQAVALAALNGNRQHLATLRGMFLQELDRQHLAIHDALRGRDLPAARHQLHQLRASSGFVGALRLQAAVAALESGLEDPQRQVEFELVLQQTRSADR